MLRQHHGTDDAEAGTNRATIRVELAINFTDEKDLTKIDKALAGEGVKVISVDMPEKIVQLELALDKRQSGNGTTRQDIQSLQSRVEQETGFETVVKGLGHTASAVSELRPSPVHPGSDDWHRQVFGVVRLSQLTGNHCLVDGLIDGLKSDEHYSLEVHEYGDLSGDAYENIGPTYVGLAEQYRTSSDQTKLVIQKIVPDCSVPSVIGRSVALSHQDRQTKSVQVVSAGVVARASVVHANKKQICSCSGKSLWQERRDKLNGQD